MRTITARQALRENAYAIVTKDATPHVYDLYPDEDTAARICRDLNARYGDLYEVAAIDLFGACSCAR